jgi:integrase
MAGLRVRHLDLMRRRAVITESVTEVRGRAVFSTPKTHQSRSVPIPRFVVDDLAARVAGRASDEFVFSAPRGGVLRARNFRRAGFEPAVAAAGLAPLTPHALRHTAASLAIAAGANVKVVQTMLGHKSATMTSICTAISSPISSTKWPMQWTRRAPRLKIVRTFCGLTAPMSMS